MSFQDEIKSLSKISENFKKNKKPKSRWPAELQLRVLNFIEVPISDKLSAASVGKKEVVYIQTAKGTKLELENEIFENVGMVDDLRRRLLKAMNF